MRRERVFNSLVFMCSAKDVTGRTAQDLDDYTDFRDTDLMGNNWFPTDDYWVRDCQTSADCSTRFRAIAPGG